MTTDPLIDSDEENADEHVRLDYSMFIYCSVLLRWLISISLARRLDVIRRLRGVSPG